MTHQFIPITTPDTTYTSMSVMKITEDIEAKLTWFIINPNYDTWIELVNPIELLSRERWCDWYTDEYSSESTPSYSYSSKTKSDNTFGSLTLPSYSFSSLTKSDNTFNALTAPSKTYTENTKSDNTYSSKTIPSKTYNENTKSNNSFGNISAPSTTYGEVTK